MSQHALQRTGAVLEQPEPPEALVEAALAEAEADAHRVAELAAAFAMFGVKEATAESEPESAEEVYRLSEAPSADPANEAKPAPAPRQPFPALKSKSIRLDGRHPIRALIALDWFIVLIAAEFAALWGAGGGLLALSIGEAVSFLLGATALKAGLWLTDAYKTTPARIRAETGAGGLALGALIGLGVAQFVAPDAKSAGALAAIVPAAALLMAGVHGALAVWIRAAHRRGVFSETIVLVGATPAAARFATRASQCGDTRIVAVVDDRLSRAPGRVLKAPVCGSVDDLLAWESLPHVDRIVITVTQRAEARVRTMIEKLRIAPNRIDLLLDYQPEGRISAAALACVSGRPHNWRKLAAKRVQDVVIGGALLGLFSPVMLIIAAAVKLDSEGPVLYRQRRHGFNNRIIEVLKFRTMKHQPGAPLMQVRANDPRLTAIGGFLRRTSLDELPQLINVLKGEMSLVGPRPHAVGMRAAERDLSHIVAEYAHRHRVKPGITGWAQVNGSRGPIETPALVRRRVKLDLEYVARASFWLDLEILLRTAPAVLGDRKNTR
ncbi:MAG: exopolysaccharide biosynthesis polyprenyl glycosylphosphotransferase [Hyphomonadaceae bacterium]